MSQYEVQPGAKAGPPATVPPFEIIAEPESKLEGLLADLEQAVAVSKEAQAIERRIKDDIKTEVSGRAPGRERIIIKSKYLSTPWTMQWRERWTIDSKMLKAVEPLIWVKFAKKQTACFLEVQRKPRPSVTEDSSSD